MNQISQFSFFEKKSVKMIFHKTNKYITVDKKFHWKLHVLYYVHVTTYNAVMQMYIYQIFDLQRYIWTNPFCKLPK